MNKKVTQILTSPKILRISLIIGAAAIALIFLSSFISFGDDAISADEYSAQLSTQLSEILSGIDGVGELRVFLTMENAGENRYLNNTDKKTESRTPTVRGVVIVCEGGDDPITASRVLDAVTKSLSISSDKVCITKLSSQ